MKTRDWIAVLSPEIGVLDRVEVLLLRLVYEHRLTQAEIAENLETTIASISARIATAMGKLACALDTPRLQIIQAVGDVA